jgi:hypothetical protein
MKKNIFRMVILLLLFPSCTPKTLFSGVNLHVAKDIQAEVMNKDISVQADVEDTLDVPILKSIPVKATINQKVNVPIDQKITVPVSTKISLPIDQEINANATIPVDIIVPIDTTVTAYIPIGGNIPVNIPIKANIPVKLLIPIHNQKVRVVDQIDAKLEHTFHVPIKADIATRIDSEVDATVDVNENVKIPIQKTLMVRARVDNKFPVRIDETIFIKADDIEIIQ